MLRSTAVPLIRFQSLTRIFFDERQGNVMLEPVSPHRPDQVGLLLERAEGDHAPRPHILWIRLKQEAARLRVLVQIEAIVGREERLCRLAA